MCTGLAKGAIDPQRPHGQEEIYYVISGAAQFRGEGRDSPVRAGDVVFVPAREAHTFHNIEEDLELLVFAARRLIAPVWRGVYWQHEFPIFSGWGGIRDQK